MNFIISTHSEQEFPLAYRKKLRIPKSKRRFVVERIYKVCKQFKLRRKTLFLAVYYLDKYLRLA